MRVDYPCKGVIHLRFDCQRAITHAMVRIGEFYESPYADIRNKKFTVEQFLKRYADVYPEACYFDDWNGYNVPGHVVRSFFTMQDFFSLDEMAILEVVQSRPADEDFYLIATWQDCDFEHELAHAFFALDHVYELDVHDLIAAMRLLHPDLLMRIENWLLAGGYCRAVLNDEINGHVATSTVADWVDEGFSGLDLGALGSLRETFQRALNAAKGRNAK